MTYRLAGTAEIPLLAELNRQLIEDEGDATKFSIEELTGFWRKWLGNEYQAVLFFDEDRICAYALFRPDEEGTIWLRQFFVCRDCRRRGVGREAMRLLREQIWPLKARIILEVLLGNDRGLQFWRAVGFRDHALVLQYSADTQ